MYRSHIYYSPAKRICITALMLVSGILLPQIFHTMVGSAGGQTLLPMHIPVLLTGVLIGPLDSALLGILLPLFSAITTGMPNVVRLPFMVCELCCLGLLSGTLCQNRSGVRLYGGIVTSQIISRLTYAISAFACTYFFNISLPPAMAVGITMINGVPGLLFQLLFIPPIVVTVRRSSGLSR